MKKIIVAFLMVSVIIMGALGWRVIHTVTSEGIDTEAFTVEGSRRKVYCAGEDIAKTIYDILETNPDYQVDSEWRMYENGDVLAWYLDDNGDQKYRYRISYNSELFAGVEFTWTVKNAGPCPLESL